MASTYTNDKAYAELQGSGENENDWGTRNNAALQDIAQTSSGYLAKDCAGSSDVTLTTEEARDLFLKCTGTLTGNINVIVPAREGPYIVWNATSGSYTLTVKTSGGTGIAVQQGFVYYLFCDATNVIRPYASIASTEFANYSERVQTVGTVTSGTSTINLASGNIAAITAGTGTAKLAFAGWATGGKNSSISLEIINGGRWSASPWPSGIAWPSGAAPTLTSTGTDWITIWSRTAGTSMFGNALTAFS